MIGLALVTLVATLGEGLRSSSREAVETQVKAPFVVVSANGFDTVPRAVGEAIATVDGAEVYRMRADRARAFGEALTVNGVSRGAGAVTNLEVEPGPDEAVLERSYASDEGLAIGDSFTLTGPDGRRFRRHRRRAADPHRGAEDRPASSGKVIISQATFDEHFPRPGDQFVFVAVDVTLDDIEGAIAAFPDIEADTRADFITARVDADQRAARAALRPARAVGDRLAVRHGQHPGADRVRADPRDRDAARGRACPAARSAAWSARSRSSLR